MSKKKLMIEAASNALKSALSLKNGESLLVISDTFTSSIGEAFLEAGKLLGAIGDYFVIPAQGRPLSEIPQELEQLLRSRDIIINAFKGMAEETPFRIKLIKHSLAKNPNVRIGHCPGISEAMMTEGPMRVDYEQMSETAHRLMEAFKDADYVHLYAPGGTNLKVFIQGRSFSTDVEIHPGHFGNLPAGEIWCGPEEEKGEGILVCDGSIGDLGKVPSPVTIKIKNGKIESIHCDDQKFSARIVELVSIDEEASIIGELGIGINPGARITGNLLEDEKAFHTAHIAFGNNEDMPGGKNSSKTHRDFLFHKPTIRVVYIDGSTNILIKDGKILV